MPGPPKEVEKESGSGTVLFCAGWIWFGPAVRHGDSMGVSLQQSGDPGSRVQRLLLLLDCMVAVADVRLLGGYRNTGERGDTVNGQERDATFRQSM